MNEPAREAAAIENNDKGSLDPVPADMSVVPAAARKSNRIWWQILALLVVSVFAVYTGASFDEEWKKLMPEGRQLASTYNKRATGLQALYKLTEAVGKPASVWEQPYRHLTGSTGMLVIIAPTESLQPFQFDQILSWVKKGNDLVYIDDLSFQMTDHLAQKLKVKVKSTTAGKNKSQDLDITPAGNLPELAHVKTLRLSSSARIEGGQPVAQDEIGAFLTVVRYGEGRVLLGTCPSILANNTIAKKEFWGNFQFITNWFRTAGGTIFFDEYAHGFSGGTNVFVHLSRGPLGLVATQILIILAVAIISESQRFGAARSLDTRRKISNLEFISGLSHAYRRAKANPAVLEILFHSFRNRLSRALAVSPHEPVERLQEAWQQSKFNSSFNLDRLLKQYEEFMTRREVSDADLKTMLETCDKITETTQEALPSKAVTSSKA